MFQIGIETRFTNKLSVLTISSDFQTRELAELPDWYFLATNVAIFSCCIGISLLLLLWIYDAKNAEKPIKDSLRIISLLISLFGLLSLFEAFEYWHALSVAIFVLRLCIGLATIAALLIICNSLIRVGQPIDSDIRAANELKNALNKGKSSIDVKLKDLERFSLEADQTDFRATKQEPFSIIQDKLKAKQERLSSLQYAKTLESDLIRTLKGRAAQIDQFHEILTCIDSKERIEASYFIRRVIDTLKGAIPDKIELKLTTKGVALIHSQVALNIGMLIFEACSNSIKHAFKTKDCGVIFVQLNTNKSEGHLAISDNGSGFDTKRKNELGIGIPLMKSFVQSIHTADLTLLSSHQGTSITISFPTVY